MKKQKIESIKNNKGITLLALIITVIVMLILVSVTVATTINDGLFNQASKAAKETQNIIDKQQTMADGRVYSKGVWYDDIDAYIKRKPSENQGNNLTTYVKAEKNNDGFLTENAIYVSGKYVAVIPKGFKVSTVTGESAISTGLVIKDAQGNEFVWIPVTKTLGNSYTYTEGYLEPAAVEQDAGKGYNFTSEYQAMVRSVNNNNGFYIGRYETTTDSNSKIGSKYNTPVLTSENWYTLYEAQKAANVPGIGTNVQTAMIYGVLWDETMTFISQNDTNYDVNSSKIGWQGHSDDTSVYYSGMLNSTDIAQNIWGLGSSFSEWTQESALGKERVARSFASVNTLFSAIVRNNNNGGTSPVYYGFYLPSLSSNGMGTIRHMSSRLIMYVL